MKQLQLSPPLLIITMGYPGSGKTFFARQFAELYDIARVSEDRIRHELFEQPQYSEDEADIINRVMGYMLEQLMQTEKTLICEGGFLNAKKRVELEKAAIKAGYKTLVVWLQTDIETSAARAATRDRRNPDSKFSFELDRNTFDNVRSLLQKPGEREVAVVVSGKHAFKSQSLTVLRKIAAIYSDGISKSDFPARTPVARPGQIRVRSNQRFVQ